METPITDMIPRYHEPEPETGTRMTNTFRCEVKKTSHCRSVTVLYCTVLYYTVLYCTVLYCTVLTVVT